MMISNRETYQNRLVRRLCQWLLLFIGIIGMVMGGTWSSASAQEVIGLPPLPQFPPLTPTEQSRNVTIAWQERATMHFRILFAAGDEAAAEEYAGIVDGVFEDITRLFSHRVSTPLTLRLYPTQASYDLVNPTAPKVAGVVAHADFRKQEVAVILPMTAQQTAVEKRNNVRHELTHIVVASMSQNRVNTGFQEGIAQYVEEHSPVLLEKIRSLRQAYEQGQLLPWSAFDSREKVYERPQMSYPQLLSVVAYLIETYGFGTFRDFLIISKQSNGYRSALERVYGKSPTELERAWIAWLPSFLDGGYLRNVLSSYDLSVARQLLQQGHFSEARAELEQAITWLQSKTQEGSEIPLEQVEQVMREAETLLERSKQGETAEQLTKEIYTALVAAEYERARQLIPQVRASWVSIGDTRRDTLLQHYAEWAERGIAAQQELQRAMSLAQMLKFPQARAASDAAAREFARLGDHGNLDHTLSFRRLLDHRQQLIGHLLIIFGIIGALVSLGGRWFLREQETW